MEVKLGVASHQSTATDCQDIVPARGATPPSGMLLIPTISNQILEHGADDAVVQFHQEVAPADGRPPPLVIDPPDIDNLHDRSPPCAVIDTVRDPMPIGIDRERSRLVQ